MRDEGIAIGKAEDVLRLLTEHESISGELEQVILAERDINTKYAEQLAEACGKGRKCGRVSGKSRSVKTADYRRENRSGNGRMDCRCISGRSIILSTV